MDDGARLTADEITVFVLDDHALVRDALTDYINTDPQMRVVGSAGEVDEALAGIAATAPAVAVLDARLREGSGMSVCREVRERSLTRRVTERFARSLMRRTPPVMSDEAYEAAVRWFEEAAGLAEVSGLSSACARRHHYGSW